ncbi:MAG TPA: hypothetical protein VKU80_06090, partial [Planctomycetota bacterium]|nr:hypothetical protein [Planctomycetota bacterium]
RSKDNGSDARRGIVDKRIHENELEQGRSVLQELFQPVAQKLSFGEAERLTSQVEDDFSRLLGRKGLVDNGQEMLFPGLAARAAVNFQEIVRRYDSGKSGRETAEQVLRGSFPAARQESVG